MNLYLIRHGQTDWNIQGRIQGRQDIPLNETGREQAEQLAIGMDSRPVSRIYCSTQIRAKETAIAIGKRQKVDVYIVEGLEEVDFGAWEGLTMTEIEEKYPEEYKRWRINPVDVAPPGGENQFEAMERAVSALRGIMAEIKDDAAIVSHGATLAFILGYLMRDQEEESEIIVNNASITTICYHPITKDYGMVSMNDTSHLR